MEEALKAWKAEQLRDMGAAERAWDVGKKYGWGYAVGGLNDAEWAAVIVPPFSARVFELVPQSKECFFLDATMSLDLCGFRYVAIWCNSTLCALPLGVHVLSGGSTDLQVLALNLWKGVLELPSENGLQADPVAPKVVMTDKDQSEMGTCRVRKARSRECVLTIFSSTFQEPSRRFGHAQLTCYVTGTA